jgi:hypothetical protein
MSPRLFEPVMLVGVALLALWVYVRVGRRPTTLRGVVVNIALSTVGLHLAPILVHPTVRTLPPPLSVALAIGAITIPALCYVMLSWVWLLAHLRDPGGSAPRGGHPATTAHR